MKATVATVEVTGTHKRQMTLYVTVKGERILVMLLDLARTGLLLVVTLVCDILRGLGYTVVFGPYLDCIFHGMAAYETAWLRGRNYERDSLDTEGDAE